MKRAAGWIVVVCFCVAGCGISSSDPPARMALTRRDPEPAGGNCKYGGVAIHAGFDHNGDGVLGDGEVDHTDYVCDVSTTVLVRKDPIAPEAGCPTGGIAVQTGVDRNRNGVLEDDEIEQTTRLCSPAELWEGDFRASDWTDPRKVTALEGVRVVAGALVIDVDTAVSLPRLALVTGNLHVQADASRVELPALAAVDGNLSVATVGDVAPSLLALDRVGGDLFVAGSGGASGLVDAPSLREVARGVRVGSAARSEVSLPGLRTIGGDLEVNGQLSALRLEGLREVVGRIAFEPEAPLGLELASLEAIGGELDAGSDFVTRVVLPGLQQIGGDLRLSGAVLTTVSIPAQHTIGGNLLIRSAPTLATLELGTTVVAGSLQVVSVGTLATLRMPELLRVTGAEGFGPGIEIIGSDVEAVELARLHDVPGVSLERNPRLAELRLPALTTVKSLEVDEYDVYPHEALVSIVAPEVTQIESIIAFHVRALDLGKLASVTETLLVGDGKLVDLSGLRSLSDVGLLALIQVAELQDLRGLASIRQIGSLQLLNNSALISLDGLEQVTDVAAALALTANPALTSIAALGNVTRVGLLMMDRNQALRDVALSSLTTVDRTLTIVGMSRMEDLSGLGAVRSVGGDITFAGNDRVSDDEITAFLRQIGR